MRVAAYYRVSSGQQRDAQTIDSQRTAAHALVASRGWDLVGEYEDDGRSARSGKMHKRTAFLALLEAAKARAFEAVIVVAFDRLTRAEHVDEMGAILGTLQRAGVRVISGGGEETDLGTFGGRISALVRAQLAAEESLVKADRSRRGHQRTAAAGRPPCAPPYGLRFVDGAWQESDRAEIVREVFRRVAGGESCRALAADFLARGLPLPRRGTWHPQSVARILRTACYDSGRWQPNKAAPAIAVPPLVDAETAILARQRLAGYRLRGLRRTLHHWLLEGIATCEACGSPIRVHGCVARQRGRVYRYSYYVCERNRRRVPGGRCASTSMRADALDAEVWAAITDWLANPDAVRSGLEQRDGAATSDGRQALADLGEWRKRLDALTEFEAEALRLRERGILSAPALEAKLVEIARKRRLLEQQIATAEDASRAAVVEAAAVADLARSIERLRGECERASQEERQRLVRLVCPAWTLGPSGATGQAAVKWATRRLVVLAS